MYVTKEVFEKLAREVLELLRVVRVQNDRISALELLIAINERIEKEQG